MKIRMTFKTPDVVYYSLQHLEEEEHKYCIAKKAIENWVEYGEYVTIEIDTETNEAKVLPVKK